MIFFFESNKFDTHLLLLAQPYTYLVIYLKQDLLVVVVYCAERDAAMKQKSQNTCDRITLRMRHQTRVRYVEKLARTNALY